MPFGYAHPYLFKKLNNLTLIDKTRDQQDLIRTMISQVQVKLEENASKMKKVNGSLERERI